MKRLALIALVVPLLALQGCDLDSNRSAESDVDDFHGIAVGDGIDVTIHQGSRHAVKLATDGGDLDAVEAHVEDGKLIITKAHGWTAFTTWFDFWSHYSADVTLPKLDYLAVRGGSNVKTADEFTGDEIEIVSSGGGSLNFHSGYRSITYRGSGGSSSKFSGKAQDFDAKTSGGAVIRGKELAVDSADLVSSGGSSIAITVNNKIVARASGGSTIRYAGNPTTTDTKARGGSDIISH